MSWYINIFGKEIPLYGLCFWGAIFICVALAVFLSPKRGMARYDFVYAAVFGMIGAVIGAKLLFILVSFQEIVRLQVPLEGIIRGGFVFYGGLGGGALGILIYARLFRMRTVDFFDLCAVVVPLGHAVGRVGCFFGGCCYGIPYDGPFSIIYTSTAGDTPLGVPLLPIQLIEALLLLFLFVSELFLYLCRPRAVGRNSLVYLTAYPILRFTLEFFRGDRVRGLWLGLSTSQWISLTLLAVAMLWAFQKYIARRRA